MRAALLRVTIGAIGYIGFHVLAVEYQRRRFTRRLERAMDEWKEVYLDGS